MKILGILEQILLTLPQCPFDLGKGVPLHMPSDQKNPLDFEIFVSIMFFLSAYLVRRDQKIL